MKTKALGLTLALCFLAAGTNCFAASPFMGTWKLNKAKSKLPAGTGHNNTVVYDNAFPFKTKVTIDGTDAHGKAFHDEWVGRFDGSDYEVTGDSSSDMRSYKEVNDRTADFWVKKSGKVVASGRITIAADGKSRTVITMGTTAKGKKYRSVAVYNKTS